MPGNRNKLCFWTGEPGKASGGWAYPKSREGSHHSLFLILGTFRVQKLTMVEKATWRAYRERGAEQLDDM